MTQKKPYMNRSGVAANVDGLAMPPLIVSVTPLPSSTAPANSHTAATMIDWGMVRALAPTEEANELATSLAPMPVKKEKGTSEFFALRL
jgi:hypothetical protein